MGKKELTAEQKKALEMKYEIAGELGLLDKIKQFGWKGLSSKESGKIGGLMRKKKKRKRIRTLRALLSNSCKLFEKSLTKNFIFCIRNRVNF